MSSVVEHTVLDVERYIQLDALHHFFTGGLSETLYELVPDVRLDELDLVDHGGCGGEEYGLQSLFERVVPSEIDGTPQHLAIAARSMLLAARILRSLDPDAIEREAARLEERVAEILRDASLAEAAATHA